MNSIEAVAGVIQLAVAPVFLLAGIAGLLGVLSTRLARIIDRARVIERRIPQAKNDEQRTLLRRETQVLWRRIALINWAIRLCIAGALAVCLVIVALFVGEFVVLNIAVAVAVLFVTAMVLIVAGLVFLLSEVNMSTRHMREGMEIALEDAAGSAQPPRGPVSAP
jgi:thiosulfate reductase cytochrome b subunit